MSFIIDTNPPDTTTANPLTNLSQIQTDINSLQKLLSNSVKTNTPLSQLQLNLISSQINSFIHQTILNATSLIIIPPKPNQDDIIEMDAVELLAEHVHFCQICGKGFKRDANLRMHMRAHGNRFKTVQALSKPEKITGTRFSCPFVGCNRNKLNGKFRPLKSVICLRNHFKRSHCPKMFHCHRCNRKSFSVVGDLKAHLKGCGERKWRCCCGTSFSRKDKLFGHVALFEGHMPIVVEEDGEDGKGKGVIETDGLDMGIEDGLEGNGDGNKNEDLERFFDGYGQMDECDWFREGFNSSNSVGWGMEGFFNF